MIELRRLALLLVLLAGCQSPAPQIVYVKEYVQVPARLFCDYDNGPWLDVDCDGCITLWDYYIFQLHFTGDCPGPGWLEDSNLYREVSE